MKLVPVTKLDKRNKTTSKKVDVDVMSENCDVIVAFRIFGQFGGRISNLNSKLLSYKN